MLRLDKDTAGRKGAAAICTMLKDMGHHCLDEPYSGGKDPNHILQIRKGLQKTPPAKAKGAGVIDEINQVQLVAPPAKRSAGMER